MGIGGEGGGEIVRAISFLGGGEGKWRCLGRKMEGELGMEAAAVVVEEAVA